MGQEALTPLDTAWQRCCIQSAISASLPALSSRQGRSARMTWKAWGRSVVLDLRQPPHCSPLGQRWRVKREQGSKGAGGRGARAEPLGLACPGVPRAGGHQKVGQSPPARRRGAKLLGSPAPFLCNTFYPQSPRFV